MPIYVTVETPVHFAEGYLQKKGVNPNNGHCQEIKYMNDLSYVNHSGSVKCVTNVPIVAPDLPVGARLYQFWENGQPWGSVPKL